MRFLPLPWGRNTLARLIDAIEKQRDAEGVAVSFEGDMVDIVHEGTARAMLAMAQELGVQGA